MTATDYEMTTDEATIVGAVAVLPFEGRLRVLRHYQDRHGIEAMLRLFAQTIGAANSVIANAKEAAMGINMPSLFGAMHGVSLAAGVSPKGLCNGCAYRKGALANQCEPTVHDARACAADDAAFLCHEKLNDAGEAHEFCAGHAQAVRAIHGKTPSRQSGFACSSEDIEG